MSNRTLKKIKIIGLGSPHGDDQAGWQVIKQLEQADLPDNIELLSLDRPGPSLINYLRDADEVILIDACDAGWSTGAIREFSLAALLNCTELQGGSSHQLGVAESLTLAAITGTQLPNITLFAIQLQHCELFGKISEPILNATTSLYESLKATLR